MTDDRTLYDVILENFAKSFVAFETPYFDGSKTVWVLNFPLVSTTKKVMELFPEIVWC